ncbi:hypothetical protein BOTCAL_0885g00010 [Botryotinia calthae]|uniref:DUF7708 domain-containing protein n=1 Tax=Botryotinia calthae TaxID=38488 RepID=A0A4Y8CHN6_9HELO|nr:hypothetical protein BOTCAL_0885g00010 [Botryotinia calthae]
MSRKAEVNVRGYIEQYGPDLDEAWDLKKDVEKIPRPPASPKLIHNTNLFNNYMHDFLLRSNDQETRLAFNSTSTWRDVQEEAGEAFKKYKSEGKSWRHPFQTTGRAFSNVACRFEFLLELLPSGDYTSIICGGLKLVFNAAKRMKTIRESVFKTFDGLSDTIDSTNLYIRYYSQDETLRLKAENLYIAILEAIKGITNWLKKNPFAESFKAFFLQEEYGKKLEEKMTTNIQTTATAFEERVKALLHIRVENIDSNVAVIKDDVADIKDDVKKINQRFKMIQSLEDLLTGIAKNADWLCDTSKDGLAKLQQNPSTSIMTNMIFIPTMPAIPSSIITMQQLLTILDTGSVQPGSQPRESPSDLIVRDRDLVSSFGRTLNPIRQGRIATIMGEPQFQSWFKSAHSQTLIINGMEMDSHWQESVSLMSYMCYLLSDTLSRIHSGSAKSLNFYCGLHSTPGDIVEGVNGMLRSIITQLLLAYGQRINLSFLDLSAIQELQNHNIQQLCRLLESLLGGIGFGIVFMMIDGISWYEGEVRLDETERVMRFLNSLVEAVEASQTGFVLKLMVTSSGISQHSREWFPAATEILMQEKYW